MFFYFSSSFLLEDAFLFLQSQFKSYCGLPSQPLPAKPLCNFRVYTCFHVHQPGRCFSNANGMAGHPGEWKKKILTFLSILVLIRSLLNFWDCRKCSKLICSSDWAGFQTSVTKVVTPKCISNHPEGLIRNRFLGPTPIVSDSVGLGRSIDFLPATLWGLMIVHQKFLKVWEKLLLSEVSENRLKD